MDATSYTTSDSFFVKDDDAFKKALIGHGIGVEVYGTFATVSIIKKEDGRIKIETQDPWAYLDQGYVEDSDIPEEDFRSNLAEIIADHILEGESAVLVRDDRAVAIVSNRVEYINLLEVALTTATDMRKTF